MRSCDFGRARRADVTLGHQRFVALYRRKNRGGGGQGGHGPPLLGIFNVIPMVGPPTFTDLTPPLFGTFLRPCFIACALLYAPEQPTGTLIPFSRLANSYLSSLQLSSLHPSTQTSVYSAV